MSWATSEIVAVLAFLLPGFVGAAVFYALTSHPKPGEFDRVVQALVFTTVGQAVAWLIRLLAGVWWEYQCPAGLELTAAVLSAVVVALLAVYCANHDIVHGALRRIGVTRETSYPSEWYSAFANHSHCYVVLYLKGRRRLYGFAQEWPSHADQGHFRIIYAEWIDEGDEHKTSHKPSTEIGDTMLIPASEVEMVSFVPIDTT